MPASSIVLDANLLVLLIVGLASPSYIASHKRLRAFTVGDFLLLKDLLASAASIVVTANSVTETSNLARQIAEPARTSVSRILRELVIRAETQELYIPSSQAVEQAAFLRLGITDAATLDTLGPDNKLLTVDLDLYLEALRQGKAAENFTHYIEAAR